jgi:hypothetical protein
MFENCKAEHAKIRWQKTVIKLDKNLNKQIFNVTIERCSSLTTNKIKKIQIKNYYDRQSVWLCSLRAPL